VLASRIAQKEGGVELKLLGGHMSNDMAPMWHETTMTWQCVIGTWHLCDMKQQWHGNVSLAHVYVIILARLGYNCNEYTYSKQICFELD